jgi:hypothetical protein
MTFQQLGWWGAWLLVASAAVIVIELVVIGFWSVSLARRAQALAVRLEEERGLIQADVARLQAAMEETRRLWRPYGRVLRLLRHPLVIALIGSYRRRWAAGRT